MSRAAWLRLSLIPLGLALGAFSYYTRIDTIRPDERALAVAELVVSLSFLLAGLVAWWRRPDSRIGPLMIALGIIASATDLRFYDSRLLWTIGLPLVLVPMVLFGQIALSYPSGRLEGRAARVLIACGYVWAVAYGLAFGAVYDPALEECERCSLSYLFVDGDPAASNSVDRAMAVGLALLSVGLLVLLVQRVRRMSPHARRGQAPLAVAAIGVAAYSAGFNAFSGSRSSEAALVFGLVGISVPIALLVGLSRSHLARASVAALLVQLEQIPADGVRDALAGALGDPSLEIGFWLEERQAYVDAEGRPLDLPARGDPRRAVTPLRRGPGLPLAALVHDRALCDEPELIAAAGAAARMALDNARLHVQVRAQLAEVEASRVRIVEAGDRERRRVERDLHDGAQQRLVALALKLRVAQRRFGDAQPELSDVLAGAIAELQAAVEELRELARGVHPAVLSEEGLKPALASLAARTPLAVDVVAGPERFPAPVEATAYFMACEALANAVKHAGAETVHIRAARENGLLRIEVIDDGVGGARLDAGTGLRGIADRLEAHGGRLLVHDGDSGGTCVVGEIPCVS